MDAETSNIDLFKASDSFLTLCRESVNPNITREDVREMIIQHILTEDIFNTIFNEIQFHRENNIARELETVIVTFFTGNLRRQTKQGIKHYYDALLLFSKGNILDNPQNLAGCGFLRGGDFLRRSFRYNQTSFFSAFRPHVYNPVRRFNYV